ncbi:Fc.00g028200.m01.CDS01 [Cosmosporella sp. VM-42]
MDSDPDADDLMAQTMGFSSFGGQNRPQKKRRYNPRADAAQGDAPLEDAGTGANTTALGATRPAVNVDEIGLDDDDDDYNNPSASRDQRPQPTEASASEAQVRPASLPQRPGPRTVFATDATPHQQIQHPGKSHQRSRQPWYDGYYDPMSNENPWERLEKAKGLEPKGSWLPRGHGTNTGGGP